MPLLGKKKIPYTNLYKEINFINEYTFIVPCKS
jgi:hypothetical protein